MASILVIDDNEILLEVISESLKQTSHEVMLTRSSLNIENILKEQDFDLVLTDIIMPDKEGIEIIIHIKKSHPNIKIIAMTGKKMGDSLDLLDIAKSIGANATIAKPFSTHELLDLIGETLGPQNE
ncbi:MAG: response regulator [Lentisphaeraceae bacterium]|nr:response regulator [Lentisphaeraceae bacterium]